LRIQLSLEGTPLFREAIPLFAALWLVGEKEYGGVGYGVFVQEVQVGKEFPGQGAFYQGESPGLSGAADELRHPIRVKALHPGILAILGWVKPPAKATCR
jgi:hypothetical protein